MDQISGSTDSIISLAMAMSGARVQNAMAVSALKKGLDAEAQAAADLLAAAQVPAPRVSGEQAGQLIDVVA